MIQMVEKHLDDSGEGLILYYKTPEMNDFISLDLTP